MVRDTMQYDAEELARSTPVSQLIPSAQVQSDFEIALQQDLHDVNS